MTIPRTLQERLRLWSTLLAPENIDTQDAKEFAREAADALDAQAALIAEAVKALATIIPAYAQHNGETPIVIDTKSTLAKLKASPPSPVKDIGEDEIAQVIQSVSRDWGSFIIPVGLADEIARAVIAYINRQRGEA